MARITTHPGEALREDFMIPLGLSANALASALDVPPNRITATIADDNPRAVTPDTALRLARYFGTSPEMWLNLQVAYDPLSVIAKRGDGSPKASGLGRLNSPRAASTPTKTYADELGLTQIIVILSSLA